MAEPGSNPRIAPLPAARGVEWFMAGLQLLRGHTLRLLTLALFLQLLAGLTQAGILGLFFFIALPALSAGMLEAMHVSRTGVRPRLGSLFAAFGSGRLVPLLIMGVLMLLAAMLAVGGMLAGLVTEVDPALVQRLEAGDPNAVLDLDPAFIERTLYGMVIGLFAGAALSYFGVPLIWFRGNGLGLALTDGIVALFRQWKPLLVLGLLLGLMSIPATLMTVLSVTHLAIGQSPPVLLNLATLLVVVVFQVIVFATQYVSYCDVFGTPGGGVKADAPEPGGGDDQLVA